MALEIRDPVHGFIHREEREQKIIDTPVFQRLRRLKQLAFANLVYPGAVHTRFEHSLGALHVAGKICDRLLANDIASSQLVRIAALLHDIGHGPFSHVSEPILQRFSDASKLGLSGDQQLHELISSRIIETSKDLNRHLSVDERERLIGLLQGTVGYKLLKDIVSGPIDADKQDYLLRDSYYCGVRYGVYDLERLTDTLCIHEDASDRYLALSMDGVHSLEQFVLAKYYMTTQVYRHRIRLITDEMIGRAIRLGIEVDGIGWLRRLYSYDPSEEYIDEYISWNDDRLINQLLAERAEGWAKRIFRDLVERRLLKCIFEAKIVEAEFSNPELRQALRAGKEAFLKQVEDAVSAAFNLQKELVIAYTLKFKPAVKTESDIIVKQPGGPRLFTDTSVLFGSVNQSIQEQYFYIFAPVTYIDDKDRKWKKENYHRGISELLPRLLNAEGAGKPAAEEAKE